MTATADAGSELTFASRLTRGAVGRRFIRLFGAQPGRAQATLRGGADGTFEAVFGRFALRTPIANIARWRIEGPWSPLTALGVRRSVRQGDITFGGSADGGVRLDFRAPVRLGPFRLPALYVTADDVEGLAVALAARGIPGEDARREKR